MSLTPEQIESNWKKLYALFNKLGDRSDAALAMLDALGMRLCLCPASAKADFHNAFPGGLVDHSLRVLGNAVKYAVAHEWKLPKDSLIIAACLHDLGKVGDHKNDYYVEQTDDWRRNKLGEEYTYNRDMQFMSVPQRGIFLCQHYGLRLTQDEQLAITLNDGFVTEENKQYCLKEPLLAHVIMTADYVATMQEKGSFP